MELVALTLLAHADGPVGSVRLAEAFVEAGIEVAEATAGRHLRQLDRAGLTLPVSTRGRIITELGRQRLAELRRAKLQNEQSARLLQAIRATDVDELVDLLYVRRAVESETARLAALRATDGEIQQIVAIANANLEDFAREETRVPSSMNFHRAVARASHNRMLIAVALMLLDEANEPLARLLDQLATPLDAGAGSGFALAHRAVVEAIRQRDPEGAEVAMRSHLDWLIALVQRQSVRVDGAEVRAAARAVARGTAPAPTPSRRRQGQ